MDDILIVDNLLPDGYANDLELDIVRKGFTWAYVDDVTYGDTDGTPGLTHVLYDMENRITSEFYPFFKPIVYSIEKASGKAINTLLRMRIGLINRVNKTTSIINEPHVDFFYQHVTACYYICDADGDTVCYDQTWSEDIGFDHRKTLETTNFTIAERCTPKKNRLFVFDGKRYHSSSTPTIYNKRIVLTVNYIPV
jgi:hypothetical protein